MLELETKTQDYWLLSLVYNDRIRTSTITTELALKQLGKISRELGDQRPLYRQVVNLTDEIIVGMTFHCLQKKNRQRNVVNLAAPRLPNYTGKKASMIIVDDVLTTDEGIAGV